MEKKILQAASVLKNGGIVAYPTDTIYGLGANAFNRNAVQRIYDIKKRPLNQPLSVLIAEMSDFEKLSKSLSETAMRLADNFWPGGLTLVVSKSSSVPGWITAGRDTIAIRIPNHSITLDLIRKLGEPLIGTSANRSGESSTINANEVRSQLGEAIDFILDGGICPGGIESTIIDVTNNNPIVLRDGAIPAETIREFLSQK